jgi:hypothetical protein
VPVLRRGGAKNQAKAENKYQAHVVDFGVLKLTIIWEGKLTQTVFHNLAGRCCMNILVNDEKARF